MSQALEVTNHQEGTKVDLKLKKVKAYPEEKVEDVKESGKPISGQKQDYQSPEDKETAEKSDSQWRVAKLWSELTKLKRIMLIAGVVKGLAIIILITLLIVSMTLKPRLVVKQNGVFYVPATNETVKSYSVEGTQPNLLTPDKKVKFSINTITQAQKRMLQEGQAQPDNVAAVVAEFDYSSEGVIIQATSPVDLIVHVDEDVLIGTYSDQRLLFEAEFRAHFRRLQGTSVAPEENAMDFDNPAKIIKDAQESLLQAVAAATDADPADLAVQFAETIDLVQQPDGSYAPETSTKSSRLLYALNSLRGLQEWKPFFNEIHEAVLKPKIEEAKAILKDFLENPDTTVDDPEVSSALQNSNFGVNIEISVSYEDDEESNTRLLQAE